MPQESAWNELVREVCQALARRDALDCRPNRDPDSAQACRQRRFWQAQARQGLHRLEELAAHMPQPELARETMAELAEWLAKEPEAEEA